jgi:ribosomal protein S18 acetylase RimI-like enzyme
MPASTSDPGAAPAVRQARPEDAPEAVPLLLGSAEEVYSRYAGGRDRALRLIDRAFALEGNIASHEVTMLAELDGTVAAALSGFPLGEEGLRSRAFLRITLRSLPPWRWPGAMRLFMTGARAGAGGSPNAFYVDALSTHPDLRRRGAARALLEDAAERARRHGLDALALDTFVNNHAARALYLDAGFHEAASRPPARGLPGSVVLVRSLR